MRMVTLSLIKTRYGMEHYAVEAILSTIKDIDSIEFMSFIYGSLPFTL